MPFESKAQQRFMFAKHPEMAKEWADKTPDISALPEHVKKMDEGGIAEPDDKKFATDLGQGMTEGINHDSDAVKSYLSSKFAQLLRPGMGEDKPQNTMPDPNPTTAPQQGMADGGYPHVTFMEDQTPEGVKETTHLAKSHEEPKMAEGGFLNDLKKGALHKELGVSEDKNIPEKKLDKAANSDDETLRKRAQFAINAKKWHHADGGVIQRAEGRDAEPAKPKDVEMSHEKKLSSIYKAMGIKKYADGGVADGGDVDISQLPVNGVPPPPPSGPGLMEWLQNFGSKLVNGPAGTIANMAMNPVSGTASAIEGAAPAIASAEGPAAAGLAGTMAGMPPTAPATPPAAATLPPTPPPAAMPMPSSGVSAAPSTSTEGMPNLNSLFNQDTSKLTAGSNPEDRQALMDKLQSQQHGLGAIIAQAVSGLGDALAAKGGKEQHSLQNIFAMNTQQRQEALANFDQMRQDRIQKLQLQSQMGDNALKQAAAADAYGTDEHLNSLLGAPKGTMKKDLPTYMGMLSAQIGAKEKDEDLYMKAHAQAATDVDNAVKNSSVLNIKPNPAQLQASGAKLADQYYNRAKGNVLVKPSDGGQAQWIPAQNLGKAKQMDPDLQVQQ